MAGLLIGQTSRQALQRQLQTIQQEIQQLEQDLKQANRQLQNELKVLRMLEKQIQLTHQAIQLLTENIALTEKEIERTREQIQQLTERIARLQTVFKRQVVFAYKFGRVQQLNWILGARSVNEAYRRYQYFQKISASARAVYDDLVEAQKAKQALSRKLEAQLAEQKAIVQEKQAEEARLKERRKDRQKVVSRIKRNRKLLAQAMQEKRRALKRIQEMITRLERQRAQQAQTRQQDARWVKLSGRFGRLKGKLNWPVRGKVLHKFGRYRSNVTGGVLTSNGIDIQAPRGTPVRCVHSGKVAMVAAMAGVGYMIIVDHNDGYYTVYAHLEQVTVQEDQFIEGGTVLGTVGELGSLEGPKLFFAIHKGEKPQDPLKWLRRR